MPLTARKLNHILDLQRKTFAGRSQIVTLYQRSPTGGLIEQRVSCIWRIQGDFDPTMEGASNDRYHLGADADINAVFDTRDVSLQQLRSTLYAVPDDPTGQPSGKYVLLDVEPTGIQPGGDRYFTKWTRQGGRP